MYSMAPADEGGGVCRAATQESAAATLPKLENCWFVKSAMVRPAHSFAEMHSVSLCACLAWAAPCEMMRSVSRSLRMRASRGFSAVAGLTPCEAASVVRTAVSGSRMRELVLVRHGESEGNVAYQRSKMGDASMYSGEFLRRHSGQWRLTDQGIEQAEAAGAWLRAHYPEGFERLYVSEYLRAKETAGHLNLPPGGASGEPNKAHWGSPSTCCASASSGGSSVLTRGATA